MTATNEITPTQDELREAQMEKLYGRRIVPNAPYRTTQPILPAHTEKQQGEIYLKSEQDKSYVELDPKTGEPLKESKEFFHKIIAVIPATSGGGEMDVRLNFQIQKYYRNQTYEADVAIGGSLENISKQKMNRPYFEVWPDNDRFGRGRTLKKTGEMIIDADDFFKRFKAE